MENHDRTRLKEHCTKKKMNIFRRDTAPQILTAITTVSLFFLSCSSKGWLVGSLHLIVSYRFPFKVRSEISHNLSTAFSPSHQRALSLLGILLPLAQSSMPLISISPNQMRSRFHGNVDVTPLLLF